MIVNVKHFSRGLIMKKLFLLFTLLLTICALAGCNKIGSHAKDAKNTTFETQLVKLDNYQFEIPSTWKRVEDPSINASLYIFAPANADSTKNSSNVALTIIPANGKNPTIEELKNKTSSFEEQIKNIFKDAKDFKFEDFKVPSGNVFSLQYTVAFGDITMTQTQYYILMDNQTVVLTATDIGDGVTPTPIEVIKHMAESFQPKSE